MLINTEQSVKKCIATRRTYDRLTQGSACVMLLIGFRPHRRCKDTPPPSPTKGLIFKGAATPTKVCGLTIRYRLAKSASAKHWLFLRLVTETTQTWATATKNWLPKILIDNSWPPEKALIVSRWWERLDQTTITMIIYRCNNDGNLSRSHQQFLWKDFGRTFTGTVFLCQKKVFSIIFRNFLVARAIDCWHPMA